jgi:hypothetical protein
MEQNAPLFSLTIDPVTKSHLTEAARWAKFLAIVGMIFLALLLIFGVVGSSVFFSKLRGIEGEGSNVASYGTIAMAAYTIIIGVIWFFPMLYTLRFANRMKTALGGNDQHALNSSFQNLKICLRYLGIITIIILAIYAVIIVVMLISLGMFSA